MDANQENLNFYLIFLRIFPGSPNWLMNICFPQVGISFAKFSLTVLVGLAPWNFFTCSAGAILRELTSTKEIMSTKKYLSVKIHLHLVGWISTWFPVDSLLEKQIYSGEIKIKTLLIF